MWTNIFRAACNRCVTWQRQRRQLLSMTPLSNKLQLLSHAPCTFPAYYMSCVVHMNRLCWVYNFCHDLISMLQQDALDLIEFVSGPAESEWGGLRAKMGHPQPWQLNYFAIGNEVCSTALLHSNECMQCMLSTALHAWSTQQCWHQAFPIPQTCIPHNVSHVQ